MEEFKNLVCALIVYVDCGRPSRRNGVLIDGIGHSSEYWGCWSEYARLIRNDLLAAQGFFVPLDFFSESAVPISSVIPSNYEIIRCRVLDIVDVVGRVAFRGPERRQ